MNCCSVSVWCANYVHGKTQTSSCCVNLDGKKTAFIWDISLHGNVNHRSSTWVAKLIAAAVVHVCGLECKLPKKKVAPLTCWHSLLSRHIFILFVRSWLRTECLFCWWKIGIVFTLMAAADSAWLLCLHRRVCVCVFTSCYTLLPPSFFQFSSLPGGHVQLNIKRPIWSRSMSNDKRKLIMQDTHTDQGLVCAARLFSYFWSLHST